MTNDIINVEAKYQQAKILYEKNHFAACDEICQYILKHHTDHAPTMFLAAGISYRQQDYHHSEKLLKKACNIDPNNSQYHSALGDSYHANNQLEQACQQYRIAHQLDKNNSVILTKQGYLYAKLSQKTDAIASFKKAYAIKNNDPNIIYGLTSNLINQHETKTARKILRKALQDIPEENKQFLIYLALAECEEKAHHLDDALAYYQRLNKITNNNSDIQGKIGHLYQQQGNVTLAKEYLHKALANKPHNIFVLFLLGELYCSESDWARVIEYLEKVINSAPHHPQAYDYLGLAYTKLGQFDSAMAIYDQCLAIFPNHIESRQQKATLLLMNDQLAAGFAELAECFNVKNLKTLINTPGISKWDGSDLINQHLLIYCEPQLEHCIQLIRYVPMIKKDHKSHITVYCPAELVQLIKDVHVANKVISQQALLPKADCYISLMGLVAKLTTTWKDIPNQVPYLKITRSKLTKWKRIISSAQLTIGIYYKPDSSYLKNHFQQLVKKYPQYQFYYLQQNFDNISITADDNAMINIGDHLSNALELAAAIKSLDLVISIDDMIVHMAGALNKPVWNLIEFSANWCWLLDKNTSPWYPSMILFRQPKIDDWHSVFEEVEKALITIEKKA